MQNKLVLFSADFPFGSGETFLEAEIDFLAEGFDEVIIISQNECDAQTRQIPPNCKVERIQLSVSKFQKIKAIFGIATILFWKEYSIVKKVYAKKRTRGIITTMLISLTRAKTVKKYIADLINRESLDAKLVIYSYWCDDVALGLAMANKKCPQLKTISRIHGWDVFFEVSKVNYLPFRHFIVENISKIFSISTDGVNYAQKNWKVGIQDKFCVSRLGVSNKLPFQIIHKDTFLLVSCSNIIPLKRVNLIAEALKNIIATPIKWVHIGDGPERNKLETLIQDLPANIQVELLGRLSNSNVKRYYAENRPDLFINVSTSEGVPVSIMEAMSFGIPVIATNVGGNNEIVSAENGYLLPSQLSPEDLANSIKSFIDLTLKQKEVKRQSSYETWKNKYNAEINFREFVKTIQDL